MSDNKSYKELLAKAVAACAAAKEAGDKEHDISLRGAQKNGCWKYFEAVEKANEACDTAAGNIAYYHNLLEEEECYRGDE